MRENVGPTRSEKNQMDIDNFLASDQSETQMKLYGREITLLKRNNPVNISKIGLFGMHKGLYVCRVTKRD